MTVARFFGCVFRGYGQMFLANNVTSGVFILAGLIMLSPIDAAWSLVGAVAVTAAALGLGCESFLLGTGFFGVNGALLGSLWVLYPEVPHWMRGVLTVAGALAMALFLVPVMRRLHRRSAPFTLFSLPYVAVAWICLAALCATGAHDRKTQAGWDALARGNIEDAARYFESAATSTRRAEAYRQDGLGWVAFKCGDYAAATNRFVLALTLAPRLVDAHDGLGWSHFKSGRYDAAGAEFTLALARAPWMADSHDGLGWLALRGGHAKEARRQFLLAALDAPLFDDAYAGLRDSLALSGETNRSRAYEGIRAFMAGHVDGRHRFVPMSAFVAWGLFLLGILCHSPVSAAMAVTGIAGCVAMSWFVPATAVVTLDVGFVYNLVALLVALGGQYLPVRPMALVWMLLVGAVMGWSSYAAGLWLAAHGWPLLCLPFNVFLLLSLAVFRRSRVPMELAVTSPENVARWARKRETANRCWAVLTDARTKGLSKGEGR